MERVAVITLSLMLGSGSDHIDYHININHISKNSDSKFLCRSLLKDSSKGIFSGKIFVDKDASNTNAILNNNNLLLSEKSEVQSNPQLEINCESVKCAHGSTSGNLDKESLFYLRSRGINQKDAMKILIEGFINKLTTNINFSLSEINGKIKIGYRLKNTQERLKEITDTFNLFSDSIDVLSYLVDLGKKSHNLDEHDKNNDNLILGCTSKAWVVVSNKKNNQYVVETDSDSHIVSGLLFLLSLTINYKSREYISKIKLIQIKY